MTTGIIIILFIIQLLTIFAIVILYSKLSRFNDLENRQNELVNEMDNAISVYLMEMREENDRLIQELKKPAPLSQSAPAPSKEPAGVLSEQAASSQMDSGQKLAVKARQQQLPEMEPRKFVPVQHAAHAYKKQKAEPLEQLEETVLVEEELFTKQDFTENNTRSFEQQVVAHYHDGKTIEEIAKMMQRGKTEIELLVKFHA